MRGVRIEQGQDLRVLCLGAHSDDIEIGCGGTLLHLFQQDVKCTVKWVVFSASADRAEEANRSASRFLKGVADKEVKVASFQNAFFPDQWADIKRFFEDELKPFEPNVVFTHYREDRHQDHRIVSDLSWNTFRNHLILEYEIPKYDGDVGKPNLFVPVSDKECGEKIDIIMDCFKSQCDKHWFSSEVFQSFMRVRGMEIAECYAEAFYARKLRIRLP